MSESNPLHEGNVRFPNLALVLSGMYIAAQMISQISSLKIGIVAGIAVDMGTFLYPLTFTLRDLVHKAIGRKGARAVVVTAAAMNLAMAVYLLVIDMVPADPSWGQQEEFHKILGPVGQLVLASILAQLLSELCDTEVYHRIATRWHSKPQWLRVLASNSVSVPLDNFIFSFVAFFGILPFGTIWQIFFMNLAVKFGITLCSLPLIYLVPQGKLR